MEEKQADGVSILLMNPQNGEIYACVNVPEFNLNDPFTLNYEVDTSGMTEEEKQNLCNRMWRNACINDTYEPGSTFKIFTMSAGLEEGVVKPSDSFSCPGFRWWKTAESIAIKEQGMAGRHLYREYRIPAIRYLLMWGRGLAWIISLSILNSLA